MSPAEKAASGSSREIDARRRASVAVWMLYFQKGLRSVPGVPEKPCWITVLMISVVMVEKPSR